MLVDIYIASFPGCGLGTRLVDMYMNFVPHTEHWCITSSKEVGRLECSSLGKYHATTLLYMYMWLVGEGEKNQLYIH